MSSKKCFFLEMGSLSRLYRPIALVATVAPFSPPERTSGALRLHRPAPRPSPALQSSRGNRSATSLRSRPFAVIAFHTHGNRLEWGESIASKYLCKLFILKIVSQRYRSKSLPPGGNCRSRDPPGLESASALGRANPHPGQAMEQAQTNPVFGRCLPPNFRKPVEAPAPALAVVPLSSSQVIVFSALEK